MNELSELISQEIKKQYKSVRAFANEIGIAQTTIVSAIKNGVENTAYATVLKICSKLGIELSGQESHVVMTDDVINLINMYSALDEKGAHAVTAFASMEFNRCKGYDDYIMRAGTKANELVQRKMSEQIPEPVIVG